MIQVYNAFPKKDKMKQLPNSEIFAKELQTKFPNCKLSELADAILFFNEHLYDNRHNDFKNSQISIYLLSLKKYENK